MSNNIFPNVADAERACSALVASLRNAGKTKAADALDSAETEFRNAVSDASQKLRTAYDAAIAARLAA